MALVRRPARKIVKRRTYKKKSGMITKKSKQSLVKLIKSVSLKACETKHTHSIVENTNLFHNVPLLDVAALNTSQSVNDDNTGTQNLAARIGDEVVARGISYKFWFANKIDRPNVMYKIVFFKYKSAVGLNLPEPYYAQGTSNFMIRDLNTEKFKIIKVIKFNLQTAGQRIITIGGALAGAEGHVAKSVWLPLNNKKIKYENGSGIAQFEDYGFSIVAYDSFGTLTTDNIASFAYSRKFYFKDL